MHNLNLKDIYRKRATYIWNLVYSLLFGFQSVFILIVLTRILGENEAGIFTLAYANASLFLLGGKYGVRNYQVSDINSEHAFSDYLFHRGLTVLIAVVVEAGYFYLCFVYRGYAPEKMLIMVLVSLTKIPDAIEDVYAGEYQKRGQLELAAKMMTARLFFSTGVLMVAVVLSKNLVISLCIALIVSYTLLIVETIISQKRWHIKRSHNILMKSIFVNCFPLFAGSFLNQYINNAPKYAIDEILSEELQARYGFIAMPVFIIGLLNNVVFAPIIHVMAEDLNNGDKKAFFGKLCRQVVIVLGITMVSVVLGGSIGIRVLSTLYSCDLSQYRIELVILLFAGGFLALVGVFNTVITIIRFQKTLPFGYFAISLAAFLGCRPIVNNYGIHGVSLYYLILSVGMAILFVILFFIGYMHNKIDMEVPRHDRPLL